MAGRNAMQGYVGNWLPADILVHEVLWSGFGIALESPVRSQKAEVDSGLFL